MSVPFAVPTSRSRDVSRRSFLALAGIIAGTPVFRAAPPAAQRMKTLAQYKSEAASYASALSALSAAPTSIASYSAVSARVGPDLRYRFSWLVTRAAQDVRVAEALRPQVESERAFKIFASSIAGGASAVLNYPGIRAAAEEAVAREAQLRREAAEVTVTLMSRLEREHRLQTEAKSGELQRTMARISGSPAAGDVQIVALVVVAIVLVMIAASVSAFSAGGGTAVNAAALGAGATAALAAVAVTAATARLAAGLLTSAAESASSTVSRSAESIAACVDAADGRYKSCLNGITGDPGEREAQRAQCEAYFKAESFMCSIFP